MLVFFFVFFFLNVQTGGGAGSRVSLFSGLRASKQLLRGMQTTGTGQGSSDTEWFLNPSLSQPETLICSWWTSKV